MNCDQLIQVIKCSDETLTEEEIKFLVKNIENLRKEFTKRYNKDIEIEL